MLYYGCTTLTYGETTDRMTKTLSNKITSKIISILGSSEKLSKPILYTLRAKILNKPLAQHGEDCYFIAKFVGLGEEERLGIAAATELGWICILMYDDIIDNDTLRYNKSAAWKKFGQTITEESIRYGLRQGSMVHPYPNLYINMYKTCTKAQLKVKELPLDVGVNAIEKACYGYRFGSYDFYLPFDNETKIILKTIGHKVMLIAQLINDYKDTCGSRRVTRNYPELREKQANYITSIYVDHVNKKDSALFVNLLKKANNTKAYERLSKELVLHKDLIKSKFDQLENIIKEDITKIEDKKLRSFMSFRMDSILDRYKEIIIYELSVI